MEFYCEDLPQHGVVLVPPSSPEYDTLLADIQGRLNNPVVGSPSIPEALHSWISDEDRDVSAIVPNRCHRGIAAIQQVWTFEDSNGRKSGGSVGGGAGWNSSLLLPFGIPAKHLKLYGYWHVILPGSKRYLNANGDQVGDNSYVRPPAADEVWVGGSGGGISGRRRLRPVHRVTLTLDGVFFVDGGFAGPNREHLWDMVVYSADIHMQVANIARQGRIDGLSPERILAGVEGITGPSPGTPPMSRLRSRESNPEHFRDVALGLVAYEIEARRRGQGDEQTVLMLSAWADARPPKFHRL